MLDRSGGGQGDGGLSSFSQAWFLRSSVGFFEGQYATHGLPFDGMRFCRPPVDGRRSVAGCRE